MASISTPELVNWAENALAVIGKGIYHHQRDGIDGLLDAELGAEALMAIVQELKKRAM